MDYRREVERSLIRGLGYRVARGLPWWVAVGALVIIWLLGATMEGGF
jgi:hypothetical protein